MRLISLIVENYKNIHQQKLDFCHDAYTTLIGLNGSGKSNWLEAIAHIFLSLYDSSNPCGFNYVLEYIVGVDSYQVSNNEKKRNGVVVDHVALPSKLIACYSGEDLRLWRDCFKPNFDKFFNDAVGQRYKEPQMLYINKYTWSISLMALLCSENPHVKTFIKEIFNLTDDIDLAAVKVDLHFIEKNIENFQQNDVTSFIRRLLEYDEIYMASIKSTDIGEVDNLAFCRKIYFFLYIATMPEKNEVNKIEKAIDYVEITYNGVKLSQLSEGHKKRILIEFASRILGDENTLFLFDEPDAHVHVGAKKKIYDDVKSIPGYCLMTSHSPLFIRNMKYANLRYIDHGEVKDLGDKVQVIRNFSDGDISYIDGAMIVSSKKLLVVEGVNDYHYITKAIELLKPDYDGLEDIAILHQNGTSQTSEFYDNVIRPMIGDLEKVIFLFDYDDAGRKGVQVLNNLSPAEKTKVKYVYYSDIYPFPTVMQHDFFVEDLFPVVAYATAPNVSGHLMPTHFYEWQKIGAMHKTIKSALETRYKNNQNVMADFQTFRPLLDELKAKFNIL